MRALESHCELPALAVMQCGQWLAVQFLDRGFVPAERDTLWHMNVRRNNFFNIEGEAHALAIRLWKLINHAHDFDVAAFPFTRKFVAHAKLSAQQRERCADDECERDR